MENSKQHVNNNHLFNVFLGELLGKVNDKSKSAMTYKFKDVILSLSKLIDEARKEFGYSLLEKITLNPDSEHLKYLFENQASTISSGKEVRLQSVPGIARLIGAHASTIEKNIDLLDYITIGDEKYADEVSVKRFILELQIRKLKS